MPEEKKEGKPNGNTLSAVKNTQKALKDNEDLLNCGLKVVY